MKGTTRKAKTLIKLSPKDSEIRYRRLFEAAQDGILILDAKTGMIEDVNPYLIKLLGYSREEFIKKKLWEVGAFKDIEASQDAFEALQKNEFIRYENLPLKAKDGRLIQVEFVSNVYLVGSEKVIQCDIRDITEHKQEEDAYKESDARFRRLVDQLPTVIYTNGVDDANTPLYISPQIKNLLGYTPEEWLTDPKLWSKTLYPEDRQHVLTQATETKRNYKPFSLEYRMVARDGHLVWVHDQFILVTDMKGQPSFWQGIMLEITVRKQAEEALRESEERFRSLIENATDLVLILNSDYTITYASPSVERILGYTIAEVVGAKLTDYIDPQDLPDLIAATEHPARTPGPSSFSMLVRVRHADGSWRTVEGMGSNLLDQPGVSGLVINARDITERKQAEEAFQ